MLTQTNTWSVLQRRHSDAYSKWVTARQVFRTEPSNTSAGNYLRAAFVARGSFDISEAVLGEAALAVATYLDPSFSAHRAEEA